MDDYHWEQTFNDASNFSDNTEAHCLEICTVSVGRINYKKAALNRAQEPGNENFYEGVLFGDQLCQWVKRPVIL